LASVIAVACDPALSLRPVGWEPSGEFQWEAESNGVHFVVGSLGGLIRSKSTSFEIAIRNTASSRFVIDGATLETNRTTYAATLSGQGEEKWRSVDPGATERINLHWSFDGPLYETFGDTATMRVACHLDANEHEIRINFRRTD